MDAAEGELARHPERALEGLTQLAAQDGADPAVWLEKALAAGGAKSRELPVDTAPRHAVVAPEIAQAVSDYRRVMRSMRMAILERLDRAVAEADIDPLLKQAGRKP